MGCRKGQKGITWCVVVVLRLRLVGPQAAVICHQEMDTTGVTGSGEGALLNCWYGSNSSRKQGKSVRWLPEVLAPRVPLNNSAPVRGGAFLPPRPPPSKWLPNFALRLQCNFPRHKRCGYLYPLCAADVHYFLSSCCTSCCSKEKIFYC